MHPHVRAGDCGQKDLFPFSDPALRKDGRITKRCTGIVHLRNFQMKAVRHNPVTVGVLPQRHPVRVVLEPTEL